MATNDVNLGTGYATGMFYHAPAGTALPAYPLETLDEAWEEVGYVSSDGITFHHGVSSEVLKDWSNTIRRQLQSDDTRTVTVPIISTTEESMKTLFGADNVVVTEATNAHGKLISINFKEGVLPGAEAFLFLMKDGDDAFMLGTTNGYISSVDDIAFQPGSPITWNATISADNWTEVKDNGQKSA